MKYNTRNQEYTIYLFKFLTLLFITVFAVKVATISILNQDKVNFVLNPTLTSTENESFLLNENINRTNEEVIYEPMSFLVLKSLMDVVFNYDFSYCSCIILHLLSSGVFMVLFDMIHTILQRRRMTKFTKIGML